MAVRAGSKSKEHQIWRGETAPTWPDEEAKEEWMKDACYEDPDFPKEVAEHRLEAMLSLYAMVSAFENREIIWGDQRVREALLGNCDSDMDTTVRCMAAGCLVKLSLARANRKAMIEDEMACKALCVSASREAPDEVRCRAYLALANLFLQLRGAEASKVGEQVIKALMLGTDKRQPNSVRARIFGVLWSSGATAADLQQMWKNLDIRYAIAAAVSPEEDREVRSNALAVLWAMATSESNRVPMWQDESTRQALKSAIVADQPSSIRVHALHTLRTLACITELQEPIWNEDQIQALLLQASSIGQPDDVRASAMRAIIELASNPRNARNMASAGIREMLLHASEDEQLDAKDRHFCKSGLEKLEGAEAWEEPEVVTESAPEQVFGGEQHDTATDRIDESLQPPECLPETHPIEQQGEVQESGLLETEPPGALQAGVLHRAEGR